MLELAPGIAGVFVAGVMIPANFLAARYFCSRASGAAVSTTNKSDQGRAAVSGRSAQTGMPGICREGR